MSNEIKTYRSVGQFLDELAALKENKRLTFSGGLTLSQHTEDENVDYQTRRICTFKQSFRNVVELTLSETDNGFQKFDVRTRGGAHGPQRGYFRAMTEGNWYATNGRSGSEITTQIRDSDLTLKLVPELGLEAKKEKAQKKLKDNTPAEIRTYRSIGQFLDELTNLEKQGQLTFYGDLDISQHTKDENGVIETFRQRFHSGVELKLMSIWDGYPTFQVRISGDEWQRGHFRAMTENNWLANHSRCSTSSITTKIMDSDLVLELAPELKPEKKKR